MSLELDFRRWLVQLIVDYLSGRQSAGAELTREATLTVLPYGQTSQTPLGVRYTPKQGNLLPRLGAELNVITVHGKRYVGALGDTRKRQPSHVVPSRGGGAFPKAYLIQPFAGPPVITWDMPDRGGVSPGLAGVFEDEFAFTDFGLSLTPGLDPNNEEHFFLPGRDQHFPGSSDQHLIYQSALLNPERAPLTFKELRALYSHEPQLRPYACGFDHYGAYTASYDYWRTWEGLLIGETPLPAPITLNVTLGPVRVETVDDSPPILMHERPALNYGSVTLTPIEDEVPVFIRAFRYRLFGADIILNPDGSELGVDLTRRRYTYVQNDPNEDIIINVDKPDTWAVEKAYASVSGGFIFVHSEGYAMKMDFSAWAAGYSDTNYGTWQPGDLASETPEDPEEPIVFPNIPGDGRNARLHPDIGFYGTAYYTGVGGYGSPSEIPLTYRGRVRRPDYIGTPPHVVNSHPGPVPGGFPPPQPIYQSEVLLKLTETERAKIPFVDGWPDPPTEASRAEVAKLNPYIYGLLPEDVDEGFAAPPYGRLANPTGPLGVESSWCGLTWTTLEYVCDAFYADVYDPVTEVVAEKLFAVAILNDSGVYSVAVSVDQTPVGTWPLFDFFPGSEGTLVHLDGSTWPPSGATLRPLYGFFHPEWPFRDVGYLAPFRVRLRLKFDKKLPSDCPITLTFDSYPPAIGRAPPSTMREFAPKGTAQITAISGVEAAALPPLLARFNDAAPPKALVTLQTFDVTVDLSAMVLPAKFRLRLYLYVMGSSVLAPDSYQPLGTPPKSNVWRFTPEVTSAQADFVSSYPPQNEVTFTVVLPSPLKVVRIGLEVQGLKNHTEPIEFQVDF